MIFAGEREALVREHNARAWLAWHIEALRRSGKRMPMLDKLLAKQTQRTRQTWQEQMHIMGLLAARMAKPNPNPVRTDDGR